MNGEAVIKLIIEEDGSEFLVTCDQFPLLALVVPNFDRATLQDLVLPVMERMVESYMNEPVTLRLVDTFARGSDQPVAPHVIATRQLDHAA